MATTTSEKIKKKPGWTHPIHARGVRSPNFQPRGEKQLTDRRIEHYIEQGFYGTDEQLALIELRKQRRDKSRKKSSRPTASPFACLDDIL